MYQDIFELALSWTQPIGCTIPKIWFARPPTEFSGGSAIELSSITSLLTASNRGRKNQRFHTKFRLYNDPWLQKLQHSRLHKVPSSLENDWHGIRCQTCSSDILKFSLFFSENSEFTWKSNHVVTAPTSSNSSKLRRTGYGCPCFKTTKLIKELWSRTKNGISRKFQL